MYIRMQRTMSSTSSSCHYGLKVREDFPRVGKMSTWQMMSVGRVCAFQIRSLCLLGNQHIAALVLCAPKGVDLPRQLI